MKRHLPPLTDMQLLEVVHLHEVEGLSAALIGKRMGRTKSAICGIIFRVRTETDATHNGHGNGTMPPRWWADRAALT